MPLPSTINDLSKTAGSNFPQGTDSPSSLDDTQRAHGSFIAQLRDGDHVTASTAKTTLVDADFFPMNDSAASNILKKITWVNIKAALKTYFDTIYAAAGAYATAGANNNITSLTALTAGGLPDNSVLTADIANAQVTPAKLSQPATLSAAVATTSGTAVDITGIPSWANEITIGINGVSTSGSNNLLLQLGATTIETSGYSGANLYMLAGSATQGSNHSTAFTLFLNLIAASVVQGVITLVRVSGNTWAFQSNLSRSGDAAANISSGVKTLAGALDRVRLTTVGATDTFDAGSYAVFYK